MKACIADHSGPSITFNGKLEDGAIDRILDNLQTETAGRLHVECNGKMLSKTQFMKLRKKFMARKDVMIECTLPGGGSIDTFVKTWKDADGNYFVHEIYDDEDGNDYFADSTWGYEYETDDGNNFVIGMPKGRINVTHSRFMDAMEKHVHPPGNADNVPIQWINGFFNDEKRKEVTGIISSFMTSAMDKRSFNEEGEVFYPVDCEMQEKESGPYDFFLRKFKVDAIGLPIAINAVLDGDANYLSCNDNNTYMYVSLSSKDKNKDKFEASKDKFEISFITGNDKHTVPREMQSFMDSISAYYTAGNDDEVILYWNERGKHRIDDAFITEIQKAVKTFVSRKGKKTTS